MTLKCITSLIASEPNYKIDFEIILVESNSYIENTNYKYPDFVNLVLPKKPFNFHEFLNIGIQESTSKIIALCNNDLIFKKEWISNILKLKSDLPHILSFSPIDPKETMLARPNPEFSVSNIPFSLGYDIRSQITGWCIVVDRAIFEHIGRALDERFDFYYADDDYGMTLRKHSIIHASVHNSHVIHLGGKTSKAKKAKSSPQDIKSYIEIISNNSKLIDIPLKKYQYLSKSKYTWLRKNPKALEGHIIFHEKWGSMKAIALKNKLSSIIDLSCFSKILYKTR
jgi:GT2 family glycosyltransferase